jgi:two-component system, sensor histidine kinase
MGGHLSQEEKPGGGSVFWLELPLTAGSIQAVLPILSLPTNQMSALLTSPAVGGLRVLVADDMAMNRDVASAFLRSAGHEVFCAENGVKAVELATANDFDVVLMDVRMPIMDGLEATRRIRVLAGQRGCVQIVALTAQAFVEQVQECQRAGMDDHLTKPISLEKLLAAVADAAARSDGERLGDRAEYREAADAVVRPVIGSAIA